MFFLTHQKRANMVFLISCILLVFSKTAPAQERLSGDEIDRISLSVVQVIAPDGSGSGSIMAGTSYVLTNRHVAEGFYEFTIAILKDANRPAEEAFKAELVSFSPDYDMALLKITSDMEGRDVSVDDLTQGYGSQFSGFPPLAYASDESIPSRGDEIALLGYPGIGDDELVYTKGTISSVKFDFYNDQDMPVWYRTNAEMSPGNSGGIAINEKGEVIGLPTYVRTESRTGGRLGSILSMQVVNAILNSEDMLTRWDEVNPADLKGGAISRVNKDLDPTYGETELDQISDNAVLSIPVTSGGEINIEHYENNCAGYVSDAPDYRLEWKGLTEKLSFSFLPDQTNNDATILIGLPDGSWQCNDDISDDNVNPGLTLNNPKNGIYNIWVGSYNESEYLEGNLLVSETIPSDVGNSIDNTNAVLDYSLDPYFGTLRLKEGFTPDPFYVSGQSGGDQNINNLGLGVNCKGFTSSAPDYRLHWNGSTTNLKISFEAITEGEDAVLIINTPDGSWKCNDDIETNNLNPLIYLGGEREGQFDIWIGSHDENTFINGKLFISELE
jgi:serine protease Do